MGCPGSKVTREAAQALVETNPRLGEKPRGPTVLFPEPNTCFEQNTYEVDIVFLHGLTGGSHSTWRAQGEQEPWPKTLLPQDIPSARIITCGYDVDCHNLSRNVSSESILGHAETLLADIDLLRKDGQGERPLIFVAHSLGGLIVQDILQCSSRDPHRKRILNSTRAIFFMGTPHGGSHWAPSALKAAKMFPFTCTNINRKPLEVLLPGSDVLMRITKPFPQILAENNIHVVCFYEVLACPGLQDLIVSIQSAQMPGCAEAIGLQADHRNMTKFKNRDEDNYRRFLRHLQDAVRSITIPAFFEAIKNDNVDIVRAKASAFKLENDRNSAGMNAVGYAAHHGAIRVFKLLTRELQAKQDEADELWKQRPLFRAAKGGTPGHLEIVKLLIVNPDINKDAKDKDGQTALAVAAARGHVEVVEILLKNGADRNLSDTCDPPRTPLSRARVNLSKPRADRTPEENARVQCFEQVVALLEGRQRLIADHERTERPMDNPERARKRDKVRGYIRNSIPSSRTQG